MIALVKRLGDWTRWWRTRTETTAVVGKGEEERAALSEREARLERQRHLIGDTTARHATTLRELAAR